MALAKVGAHSVMGPLLPRVADQIKEAISVKGRARPNCPEALQCVGVLAQALGSTWKTEATSLVQPMMSTGLSQPLVKTLQVGNSPGFLGYVAYGSKLPERIGSLLLPAILPAMSLPYYLPYPCHIACHVPAIPCHIPAILVWALNIPEFTSVIVLHCFARTTNHTPCLHPLGFPCIASHMLPICQYPTQFCVLSTLTGAVKLSRPCHSVCTLSEFM